MPQSIFGPLSFGDIAKNRKSSDNFIRVVEQRRKMAFNKYSFPCSRHDVLLVLRDNGLASKGITVKLVCPDLLQKGKHIESAFAECLKLAETKDTFQGGIPDGVATLSIKCENSVRTTVDQPSRTLLLLKPEQRESVLGDAEVLQVFKVSKVGTIAGSMVRSGVIARTAKVRVVRDGTLVYTGAISSLKRFKDDAKEVREGLECGIGVENFNDLKVGDRIEAFRIEEIKRTLAPAAGATA